MSMTKEDDAPAGEALREKEEGKPEVAVIYNRKLPKPDELDTFIDAVISACEIDGLPRATTEAQASAMADVSAYLPPQRREALRKILGRMLDEAEAIGAASVFDDECNEPSMDKNDLD